MVLCRWTAVEHEDVLVAASPVQPPCRIRSDKWWILGVVGERQQRTSGIPEIAVNITDANDERRVVVKSGNTIPCWWDNRLRIVVSKHWRSLLSSG